MSDRVHCRVNDEPVDLDPAGGATLLTALREQLGIVSVKDGCAPQGQCGCCTVLVDGEPRVACVTPLTRVAGRSVTTVEGLDPGVRSQLADAFLATGGSQCGFCTPGILVRAAALRTKGKHERVDFDRALAAHLCRCTGWQTVYEALERGPSPGSRRNLDAASRRAELEGGVRQRVAPDVPIGAGGFADDSAPRDALVALPMPPGAAADGIDAEGVRWVVADTLDAARAAAGKVQGRRTTTEARPPLAAMLPRGEGVRLATSWVEPAYLEPDASWCEPGGEPASPLANGGAFGGKTTSLAPAAARALADRLGRAVRVVLSREDTVRLGAKRPPIAAVAHAAADATVRIDGLVAGEVEPFRAPIVWPLAINEVGSWSSAPVPGPPTARHLRAVGWAERTVLVAGALHHAGFDPMSLVHDDRVGGVLLATVAAAPSGALAGAHVEMGSDGRIERIRVKMAAGDPLDDVVLRSYAIGAAHMALGWVLTEGVSVDGETGEVHDLTIRSFGVIRAQVTPPIDVEIVDDPGEPLARATDAVFAAVAAATWNAVTDADGARPDTFPASGARAARWLRR